MDHARINADFPEVARNDATSPARLSDHDPVVAYFELAPKADLAVTATSSTGSVTAGQALAYTATVRNDGPETASAPGVGFSIAGALPDLAVTPSSGWSCDTAQVADGMTSVACNTATLDNAGSASFTIRATSIAAQSDSNATLAVAATSQTFDPDSANNQAVTSIQVAAPPTADIAVSIDGPASIKAYQLLTRYVVTATNAGQPATRPVVVIGGNTMNILSLINPPSGWSCSRQGNLRDIQFRCTGNKALANGAKASFPVWVTTGTARRGGTVLVESTVSTTSSEANTSNNSARFTTLVK
ncbi:MAG: hypothetical protein O8I58_14745 [Pseudoxanthomonas sp.]|nr:hypothetical protein [Pseudoxanthomonas sp.]WDS38180.1 MAG: hypothetical protein O8I58_14745 [Pseudoxanthomonas sp.]